MCLSSVGATVDGICVSGRRAAVSVMCSRLVISSTSILVFVRLVKNLARLANGTLVLPMTFPRIGLAVMVLKAWLR